MLLALTCTGVCAQTYHSVTPYHYNGTYTIGGNSVTIMPLSGATNGTSSQCGVSNSYLIGDGASTGFKFSFSQPVSDLRITITGIQLDEVIGVKINNTPFTITPAHLAAYPGSCNTTSTTALTTNGELTSYVSGAMQPNQENARIYINSSSYIWNVEIFETIPAGTGGPYGSVFDLAFANDTCYHEFTATGGLNCDGRPINLSSTYLPNFSYAWAGPNGYYSSDQNPIISSASAANEGVYLCTATYGNCILEDTAKVVVNPVPVLSGTSSNTPVCRGTSILFDTDVVPGATYQWTGPAGFNSTQHMPAINYCSFANEGDYYLTATVDGCESEPDTIFVDIDILTPTPTAGGGGQKCLGEQINLTANTIAGATYKWYGPNGYFSADQNPVIAAATLVHHGDFSVVADINGCLSEPDTESVEVLISTPTPNAGGTNPTCPGTTLQLNVGTIPGANYIWTGPGGYYETTQNPIRNNMGYADAGDYIVTAIVNGCSSIPDTIAIVVDITTPTPNASGNGPLCPGKTFELRTDSIPGASYNWAGPGFTATTANTSVPDVQESKKGYYIVWANVNGCISRPDSVLLEIDYSTPRPGAVSNSPVCYKDDIRLSATNTQGNSYTWGGPNGFTATEGTTTLKGMWDAAGTYWVYQTINGCNSLADSVQVSIRELPVAKALSNSPICEQQDNIVLQALPNKAGNRYQWYGPGGFAGETDTIVRTNTLMGMEGDYYLRVTEDGCTSDTVAVHIDMKPKPLPPSTSVTKRVQHWGEIVLHGYNNQPGANYYWTGPNNFYSTETDIVIKEVTEEQEGDYTFNVLLDGCLSYDGGYAFVDTITYYTLYPNPNNGIFTIRANFTSDRSITAKIIDITGRTIHNETLYTNNKILKKIITVPYLSKGVYILRLTEYKKTRDIRFVVD
jgi:hypothetical protein